MSAAPSGDAPDTRPLLAEAVGRLQQQLLQSAQRLLVTLERPATVGAVADDVRGDTLHGGPGRLGDAERDAMCESLRQDIQTLQQLTELLAQLDMRRGVFLGRIICTPWVSPTPIPGPQRRRL
jgi:hypothetical protein